MRTVYIMVEGHTEEEFVNNSLAHYLKEHDIINTIPVLLETSPGFYGGDISFDRYARNARNLLITDRTAIVTSLIDYYKLRRDFPGYAASVAIVDKNAQVDYLEQQIAMVITDTRLIPYIQLHEFEGLLFSDIRGFDYLKKVRPEKRIEILNIMATFPNPELINDGDATAPSVRLKGLIPRYKKTYALKLHFDSN
jgi:hypothetical protein